MEYKISSDSISYTSALLEMEERVLKIIEEKDKELIWFLQHPSIYTAGTSAEENELISKNFPVFNTGRGGKYTYHGPGQRIIYLLLNLKKRNLCDIKKYIFLLEEIVISTLAQLGLDAVRKKDAIGVWSFRKGEYSKLAALGVRIKKWVSYHGISINLNPNLEHYKGIIPCGLTEDGVTSLWNLGCKISLQTLDELLKKQIWQIFPPLD